jgi:hypothetical protein
MTHDPSGIGSCVFLDLGPSRDSHETVVEPRLRLHRQLCYSPPKAAPMGFNDGT